MTRTRSALSAPTLACLVALVALMSSMPAQASPAGDALGRCLADNTTGKDRKDLARWVFVSMAAHPEIRPLAAVPPSAVDRASRDVARMMTTVLVDRCPAQARAALRVGGSAFESAFSTLGELAMVELMTDPDVNTTLTAFERYLDQDKLAVLEE